MALVYIATLTPSKQELVEPSIASRSWGAGRALAGKLAEYRFDDPEGEVGVETILWQADDGQVLQTPLTYRAAPLEDAEAHLIGTAEHSVLGTRWVYDGCADPVWAATLSAAIVTGGTEAHVVIDRDGASSEVPPRMQVRGSGNGSVGDLPVVTSIDRVTDEDAVTVVRAGDLVLTVARVVGSSLSGEATLTGRLGDSGETVQLASLRRAHPTG